MRHLDIVSPFYGEFGFLILKHVRYVHYLNTPNKIVCCPRGHESLYPTATGFFYDYNDPVPQSNKHNGNWYIPNEALDQRLRQLFPTATIIQPVYDCHWHVSDLIKPSLKATPYFDKTDLVISPRNKSLFEERNWKHWPRIIQALQHHNFKIGIAGSKETSTNYPNTAQAWDHPDGDITGSIDLLNNTRLYLGTDSGLTHLAALLDISTLAFRNDKTIPEVTDMLPVADRTNKKYFKTIKDGWDDPDAVLGQILLHLSNPKMRTREFQFWSQYGEDRFVKPFLPQVGVYCEVGASDGVGASNTLHFERSGWTGVLIEPDPRHDTLEANRPDSKVFRCAAASTEGLADFHLEERPSWSGLERTSPNIIKVRTKTLTNILKEAKVEKLDLLSIDTEGTELDVWKSLSPELYPTIAILEWDTTGKPSNEAPIETTMLASGYELLQKTAGNLIFKRK